MKVNRATVNLELKAKIVRQFRVQGAAAKALQINESRLSRIVSGISEPTDAELEKFAAIMGPEILKTLSGADRSAA